VVRPPSYDAYVAFDRGFELYAAARQRQQAVEWFDLAISRDPDFLTPLISTALLRVDFRRYAEADSLVSILERSVTRLSPYDRQWVRYLRARVRGRSEEALDAIRQAARLAPGSKAAYNWALMAARTNRWRESLDACLSLHPERGPMRDWAFYWWRLAQAYHLLGEYENELEVARRARPRFPTWRPAWAFYEIRALGAMNRLEEVTDELEGDLMWRASTNTFRSVLIDHMGDDGFSELERQMTERILDWLRTRPVSEEYPFNIRDEYGHALFAAGRLEEAQTVYTDLVEGSPEHVVYRGRRGVVAAVRGDSAQAREDLHRLQALDRTYLHGENTFYQAAILSALGRPEEATDLARVAFEEGKTMGEFRHVWLDTLRDYPPFRRFLEPRE
jgi:tetratricopeptide (TPR) repeat protein